MLTRSGIIPVLSWVQSLGNLAFIVVGRILWIEVPSAVIQFFSILRVWNIYKTEDVESSLQVYVPRLVPPLL